MPQATADINKPKFYFFLNLNMFIFAAGIALLLFLAFVLYLIGVFPFLYSLLILFAVSTILLICTTGLLSVKKNNHDLILKIRSLTFNATLHGPFSIDRWWNYATRAESANGGNEEGSVDGSPTHNHINVYYSLSAGNGQSVLFREHIALDLRYPNEVKHRDKTPKKHTAHLLVQRTDKLAEFLDAYLEQGEE